MARCVPPPRAAVVTAEVVRVSMNVAELAMIVGFAFALGCAAGWWVRGR